MQPVALVLIVAGLAFVAGALLLFGLTILSTAQSATRRRAAFDGAAGRDASIAGLIETLAMSVPWLAAALVGLALTGTGAVLLGAMPVDCGPAL